MHIHREYLFEYWYNDNNNDKNNQPQLGTNGSESKSIVQLCKREIFFYIQPQQQADFVN